MRFVTLLVVILGVYLSWSKHGYDQVHKALDIDQRYFSQSYFQARKRFRKAAEAAGATLSKYKVVTDELSGENMTIDVATIEGKTDPSSVLVHISGTHGVEGYAGSAIQIQALDKLTQKGGANTSLITQVFVHSLNPFGMMHHRRYNENNVDLNRNNLSPEKLAECTSRPPNQYKYEDFSDLINPVGCVSWFEEQTFFLKAAYYLVRYGYQAVKAALVTGQYHNERGGYFGGKTVQRSHEIMREILGSFKATTKRLILIDVHTGLGPSGVDTLMVGTGDERKRTYEVFPLHDKAFVEAHTDSEATGASAGYADGQGYVSDYPNQYFGDLSFHLGVTQEFGTVPGPLVVRAQIRESAGWNHARWTLAHVQAASALSDVFYVKTEAWKVSVLSRGQVLIDQALEFLSK